jgi:tetratricopeptide (TPR) repeat protein
MKILAGSVNLDKPNKYRDYPVHMAALNNHADIIEVLHQNNIPLDRRNEDGYTAADLATYEGNESALQMLTKCVSLPTSIVHIHVSWILHNATMFAGLNKNTIECTSTQIYNGRGYCKAMRYYQAAMYHKKKGSCETAINHLRSARALLKGLSLYSPTVQVALVTTNLYLAAEVDEAEAKVIDDEAISIYRRFKTDHLEKLFESEHLARAFNAVSKAWEKFGDNKRALLRKQTALEGFKLAAKGKDSINVAALLSNVGLLLDKFGKKQESIKYKKEGLEMLERICGDKPDERLATSMNNIGITYQEIGDRNKALEYHERALMLREKLYNGPNDKIASSLNNYGIALNGSGRRDECVRYLRRALAMNTKLHPNGHRDLAISYANLGATLLYVPSLLEEATDYLNRAMKMFQETDNNTEDIAACHNNLGLANEKLGNDELALEYKEKALEIRLKNCLIEPIAMSLACLGECYARNPETRNKGLDYLERSIGMFERLNIFTVDRALAISSVIIIKLDNNEDMEQYTIEQLPILNRAMAYCSEFNKIQLTKTCARALANNPDLYNMMITKHQEAILNAETEHQKIIDANK